jgi:hypothetical protein
MAGAASGRARGALGGVRARGADLSRNPRARMASTDAVAARLAEEWAALRTVPHCIAQQDVSRRVWTVALSHFADLGPDGETVRADA